MEEEGGRLYGFECKWSDRRWQPPALFTRTYPEGEVRVVNRENYLEFLT